MLAVPRIVLVMLPHASTRWVAAVLGTYALVFGALLFLAALRFWRGHAALLTRAAT